MKNKSQIVIRNQILGTLMIYFILAVCIFLAIGSKDLIMIIISVILGILTLLFTFNAIKVIKKEKGKKIKYDINYNLYIILIILCTMFGISLFLLSKNIIFRINGVETTATIYKIDREISYKTEYDDDGNSYDKKEEKCDVYIKYYVEEKEYDTKLDVNSCNHKENDKIKIYYEKDNPNNFVSNSIVILIIANLITGFGLVVFIVQWIKSNLRKNKKKKDRKQV